MCDCHKQHNSRPFICILPTAEIIKDHRQYDELFCFYMEGIRGLVRDIVLCSDYGNFHRIACGHQDGKITHASGLIESVMRMYNNSPEAMLNYYLEKTSCSSYVESVVEMLDDAVTAMMAPLVKQRPFNVNKQEFEWIGNDLMIKINLVE